MTMRALIIAAAFVGVSVALRWLRRSFAQRASKAIGSATMATATARPNGSGRA